MIRDYTSGPVGRQLLAFAWPFMLSNLLQTAYNLVDMAVVGRYVGPAGLSAVGVGADVIHLFTFVCMGFCNAGQVQSTAACRKASGGRWRRSGDLR